MWTKKMKPDRSEPLPINRTPCDCEENGQCKLIGGPAPSMPRGIPASFGGQERQEQDNEICSGAYDGFSDRHNYWLKHR